METKRSILHYRDHEVVCVVEPEAGDGWHYTIHVVAHVGDTDVLRRQESSVDKYYSDIDALQAAQTRARELVDAMVREAQ